MMPTEEIKHKLGLDTIPEPGNSFYQCFDDGGVETAVGEFLYSLVRMIRPERILETGLYSGISCMYMSLAERDNGVGRIDTLEWEKKHIGRSKERLIKLGVKDLVDIHHTDSLKFAPQDRYQLMFLDTEPWLRYHELARFYPNLDPGGYVFIHDMPRGLCQGNVNPDHPEIPNYPVQELPKEVSDLIGAGELAQFMFDTPRGLAGYYKRHDGDYKWGGRK